jgi:formate/nitrite transporter FocA (FNT family)
MYTVITYGLKLFTGMVSGIPTMGAKNFWQLPVCFLANAVGCIAFALIVRYSFIGDTLVAQANSIIAGKLSSDNWAVKTLFSAIACGLLITFSVWSPRYAPDKKLAPTIGVMLPIVVFVFCGFDHSVAAAFYLSLATPFTWQIRLLTASHIGQSHWRHTLSAGCKVLAKEQIKRNYKPKFICNAIAMCGK